jgi:hypothetical protein
MNIIKKIKKLFEYDPNEPIGYPNLGQNYITMRYVNGD